MNKKLLKTLLPIAGATTITAPLITLASCGQSQQFQFVKDGVINEYKTKITAETKQFATIDEVASYYWGLINKNKKVYADDLFLEYNLIISHQPGAYKNFTLELSNFSSKNNRLSFDLKEILLSTPAESYETTATMSFKNYPFLINQQQSGNFTLSPQFDVPTLQADQNWSVKATVASTNPSAEPFEDEYNCNSGAEKIGWIILECQASTSVSTLHSLTKVEIGK